MSATGQFDVSLGLPYPLQFPKPAQNALAWETLEPHMSLVRHIAARIRSRLPGSVELDDLEQAGTIGLMAALSSAEAAGRECSVAYLRLRIQGAILDSLREYDWASRYMRARSRKLQDAHQHLRQELGREPGSEELAEHLDLDLQSYFELAACSQAPSIVDRGTTRDGDEVAMEDLVEDDVGIRHDRVFENQELRRIILMGAATLGAEHCVVLLLYYVAEWTGAQIARALQLSEARVSQLRSVALASLRRRRRIRHPGQKPPKKKRAKAPCSPTVEYRSERKNRDSCLRALLEIFAACEPSAWQHCLRVEAYAARLARQIGFPAAELPQLLDAALLHDLGAICIPGNVLHKPGPLDPEEFRIVRRHVEVAADILSSVATLRPLAAIVRHHHENFDGSGYPDRLRGDAIPLASRIISVVDALDAITSERSYRQLLDFHQAKDNILASVGRYDPAILEAFLAIPADEWDQLRTLQPSTT